MSSTRPLPNRRSRETSPEQEAKIEAFAKGAETLQSVADPVVPTLASKKAAAVKEPKNRSYTFRMTEETLNKLRFAAEREDRSIQWVFDKMLLPHLDE